MVDPDINNTSGYASSRRDFLHSLVDEEAGARTGTAPFLQAVCRVSVQILHLAGAAASLMSTTRFDASPTSAVVATSDERARRIEELEFSTGEGPGITAFLLARPVLTPDLDHASGRWPAYAPAARAAGAVASFAFPMHVGAVRLGVLHFHGVRPHSLAADEVATCLTLTEIATTAVLDAGAHLYPREFDRSLLGGSGLRDQIYQAQGMTAIHLGISLTDALARMRAHAFATGRDLAHVAAELLAGTTQLPRLPNEQQ